MAIVARRPDHGAKGLIVLTHKERATFGAPVMRSALEMMRDEYVILMHWGHHHSDVDDVVRRCSSRWPDHDIVQDGGRPAHTLVQSGFHRSDVHG